MTPRSEPVVPVSEVVVPSPLSLSVHGADGAQTLKLGGALSVTGASRTVEACRELSVPLQRLHLDLAGLRLYDATALAALVIALSRWSQDRGVALSYTLPPCALVTPSLQSRGNSEMGSKENGGIP